MAQNHMKAFFIKFGAWAVGQGTFDYILVVIYFLDSIHQLMFYHPDLIMEIDLISYYL